MWTFCLESFLEEVTFDVDPEGMKVKVHTDGKWVGKLPLQRSQQEGKYQVDEVIAVYPLYCSGSSSGIFLLGQLEQS